MVVRRKIRLMVVPKKISLIVVRGKVIVVDGFNGCGLGGW